MLLRRSLGLVWLGRKPHTAAAVSQITGLRHGILAPGTHLVSSPRLHAPWDLRWSRNRGGSARPPHLDCRRSITDARISDTRLAFYRIQGYPEGGTSSDSDAPTASQPRRRKTRAACRAGGPMEICLDSRSACPP